jgi:hypothetical protein
MLGFLVSLRVDNKRVTFVGSIVNCIVLRVSLSTHKELFFDSWRVIDCTFEAYKILSWRWFHLFRFSLIKGQIRRILSSQEGLNYPSSADDLVSA